MKTKVEDFTEMEIKKFNEMYQRLKDYNHKLNTDDEIPAPGYSDEEKIEYSRYCEIVLDERARTRT